MITKIIYRTDPFILVEITNKQKIIRMVEVDVENKDHIKNLLIEYLNQAIGQSEKQFINRVQRLEFFNIWVKGSDLIKDSQYDLIYQNPPFGIIDPDTVLT